MGRGPQIALAVLLVLGHRLPAAAAGPGDPIPVRVQLEAPLGCSTADAFFGGLAARSSRARRAGPDDASAVRLVVRITRSGGKVHGELRMFDGRTDLETRRVEGERCEEVVEVLSLTAALALDPTARLAPTPAPRPRSVGRESASGPPPVSAPVVPDAPPEAPLTSGEVPSPTAEAATPNDTAAPDVRASDRLAPKAASSPRQLRLTVGAQALGARVLAPGVSLGGGLSIRLSGRGDTSAPPRSIALTASYLSNEPLAASDGVVARWLAAAATVCPGLGHAGARVAVDLCAHVVGGWLHVFDEALTHGVAANRFWGAAGLVGRFGVGLGDGLSLEAEVVFALPVVERRFVTTTPEQTVGSTPPLFVGAGLGLARTF